MPAFHEVEFPRGIARGARGGPRRSTVVVRTRSGAEQRIALWEQSLGHWDCSQALRNNEQRDTLIAFWEARSGPLYGFRFHAQMDYRVTEPADLVVVTSSTFQLAKRYSSGGVERVRVIKKPVGDDLSDTAATQDTSTVQIFTDTGSEVTAGWSVDLTQGLVTFDSAPGYTPKWTGEFSVPVRFGNDELSWEESEVTYGSWGSCVLEEIRI